MKNKIIKILKPYLILVILFVVTGYIFNTVETFLFCKYQDSTSFSTIIQSYFNITTVFCLYSLIILPFYLLVGFFKQKLAQVLVSILFSILILLEIGLYIYYKHIGVLMGTELIVRPISEILLTIRNSSDIIIDFILIILTLSLFIVLPFVLKKIKIFNHSFSLAVGILVIGTLSASAIFYQKVENKTTNNYLESKSFYFFSAVTDYLIYDEQENTEKIEKNETILKEYVELYPDRTILDLDYPMERPAAEIPDVLSPFLKKSEKQPNIVIIICESLGSYLMGEKGKNISFTPYLDSLASVGLYWKNCLATSARTFGVVPSVVGSVPHGMRGFQFGIMPKHYSLFSILKDNDYSTNFFYGGDPNFDCMLDFLTVQETDHIDDFQSQMSAFRENDQANWWALYDHVLFDKSLNYLKTISLQKSRANVYLTLTSHDPFSKGDKGLKEYYDSKTEKVFSKLDSQQRKYFLSIKDYIATFIYLDDCIKKFINDYSKQPDFENTLFIITGDHSAGILKNSLSEFSVPLIIWSPLLERNKSFPNIVSHWAITPSIISFLNHNYDLKVSDNIAWCSDGLDTASVFAPSEKVLFLSYDRTIKSMVYEQYFVKNENSDKKLYKIDENLDLEIIDDPVYIENINSKFNTLKYVNNYVYHNNKLIKHNKHSDTQYKMIKGYENNDTIVCKTPDTIPSVHGIDVFEIMPVQEIKGKYNKIKIKLMADLIINDYLYQDQYMMLNFICRGDNYEYISKENITKYIADEDVVCSKKYELSIEKEIDINDIEKFSIHICITSNEYDTYWRPDKKITISNIKSQIFGK